MLNDRQLATVLAGLRLIQRSRSISAVPLEIVDIQKNIDKHSVMNDDEIDELCQTFTKNRVNIGDNRFWSKYRSVHDGVKQPLPLSDATRLADTPLSTRLKNGLADRKYFTIGDLRFLSQEKFLMFPGLGRSTLLELERYIGRSLINRPVPNFNSPQERRTWYEDKRQ